MQSKPTRRRTAQWAWLGIATNMCGTAEATRQDRGGSTQPPSTVSRQTTLPVQETMRENRALNPCLKSLKPVEALLGDGGQRARGQERKRTSEAALSTGGPETPVQWLDAMMSTRATVMHVEPCDEDGFHRVPAKVTIGDRTAHLRIRVDPEHEARAVGLHHRGGKDHHLPARSHARGAHQANRHGTYCEHEGGKHCTSAHCRPKCLPTGTQGRRPILWGRRIHSRHA